MSEDIKKREPQNDSLAREKNTKDGLTLIKCEQRTRKGIPSRICFQDFPLKVLPLVPNFKRKAFGKRLVTANQDKTSIKGPINGRFHTRGRTNRQTNKSSGVQRGRTNISKNKSSDIWPSGKTVFPRRFVREDRPNKSTTVRHKFTSDGQMPDDLSVQTMICSSSSVKTAIEINLFAGGLRKSKDVIMQIKRYQLHYRCYLEQFYSSEVNCFSIEVINAQQQCDNNENNHSRILAVRSHQVF